MSVSGSLRRRLSVLQSTMTIIQICNQSSNTPLQGEWPSGLYCLRQVTEVKLGQVRSNSGWVTSEA